MKQFKNESHLSMGKPRVKAGAPEYRAMNTKGIPLAGKISLKQYELLVRLGLDGDVIKAWTKYRAHQIISKLLAK